MSIALDIGLTIYYFGLVFYSPLREWMAGLAIWYLILAVAKLIILVLYKKCRQIEKRYIIERITAIFIFVIGLAIIVLTAIMYFYRIAFSLPNGSLYINGAILATLTFSFLGRKHYNNNLQQGHFTAAKNIYLV